MFVRLWSDCPLAGLVGLDRLGPDRLPGARDRGPV